MLREQGNLIDENIPITKELIEFAYANNYKISLKTGDYYQGEYKSNKQKYNIDLLHQLNEVYMNGDFYIKRLGGVFGLNYDLWRGLNRRHKLHKLTAKERIALYSEEICETRESTWMETIGYTNPSLCPSSLAKREATCMKSVGAKTPFDSPKVQAKIKQILLEDTGYDNPFKNPATRAKSKQTLWDNHRVEHNMQIPEVVEKAKKSQVSTNMERYKVPYPIILPSTHGNGNLTDEEAAERYFIKESLTADTPEEAEYARRWLMENYSGNALYDALVKLKLHDRKKKNTPITEIVMMNILDDLDLNYEHDYYPDFLRHDDTKFRRELDFFLPDFNLVIEVNGDYLHRHEHMSLERHEFKYRKCIENNTTLISVTEYDLNNRRELVVQIIKYLTSGGDKPEVDDDEKFRFALIPQTPEYKMKLLPVSRYYHWYPVREENNEAN